MSISRRRFVGGCAAAFALGMSPGGARALGGGHSVRIVRLSHRGAPLAHTGGVDVLAQEVALRTSVDIAPTAMTLEATHPRMAAKLEAKLDARLESRLTGTCTRQADMVLSQLAAEVERAQAALARGRLDLAAATLDAMAQRLQGDPEVGRSINAPTMPSSDHVARSSESRAPLSRSPDAAPEEGDT